MGTKKFLKKEDIISTNFESAYRVPSSKFESLLTMIKNSSESIVFIDEKLDKLDKEYIIGIAWTCFKDHMINVSKLVDKVKTTASKKTSTVEICSDAMKELMNYK